MDGDKQIHLTELGREVAESIYERHCILKEGLIYLGVDKETAEQDACRIEHDISRETFERLKEELMRHVAYAGLNESQLNNELSALTKTKEV